MNLKSITDKINTASRRPLQKLTDEELTYLINIWGHRHNNTFRMGSILMESLERAWSKPQTK